MRARGAVLAAGAVLLLATAPAQAKNGYD